MNTAQRLILLIGLAVAVFMALYPPYRYDYDGYGQKSSGKLGYAPLVTPPSNEEALRKIHAARHGETTFSEDPARAEKQKEAFDTRIGSLARFCTIRVDKPRLALQEIPILILTALLFILARTRKKPDQPA